MFNDKEFKLKKFVIENRQQFKNRTNDRKRTNDRFVGQRSKRKFDVSVFRMIFFKRYS